MEINGRFLDELEIKRIERELSNFNPVPKIGDGVIFDSGTKMYRFITPGDNAELGQWWFDGTFKKRIERFQKMKSVQKNDTARSWLAIKEKWNDSMVEMIEITLMKKLYGWRGPAKSQVSSEYPNVIFMGSGDQVFLPNLSDSDVIKNGSLVHKPATLRWNKRNPLQP